MSSLPFRYPAQAVLLPVSELNFGDRTRTSYPNLEELADSILSGGLIHPPTVNLSNQLIAGGRRTRAMIDILKVTHIPVVYLETADEAHLRYLEDQENHQRVAIHWTDRVRGIHRIHTAKTIEAALSTDAARWTVKLTGGLLNMSQANVSLALMTVPFILSGDPEILAAENLSEALRILTSRKEKEAMAKSLPRNLPQITTSTNPLPITGSVTNLVSEQDIFGFSMAQRPADTGLPPITMEGVTLPPSVSEAVPASQEEEIDWAQLVVCGDSIEWMHAHPESADHIVTDIPYGIDMANLSQQNTGMDVSATESEHDVDYNLSLFQKMFPAMYVALKDKGFAVLFCDMQHWWALAQLAQASGFKVQRWPLVWNKLSSCLNQAAQYNFTKNFEVALVLRKGNATLVSAQATSVFSFDNADKAKFGHPFSKPLALWTAIYKAVALPGQIVLDPFCGSGTASVAALKFGLVPLAVDIVPDHVNLTISNLKSALK